MIGPLISLFVATFMLVKKHGFDIFKPVSTKDGIEQQNPQLAKLDPLELYGIVVNDIPDMNVHNVELTDQGRSGEDLPSVET